MLLLTLQVPEIDKLTSEIANPGYMGNLLVMGLFLVVILVYGFILERHTILANLLALYTGLMIVNFWPESLWLGWMNSWWAQIALLAMAVVVVLIILWLANLFRVSYSMGFFTKWWQAIISGFLYAGLLISVILSIVPTNFLAQFSPGLLKFFASETARFVWLLAPIFGLLLIKQKRGPGRPAY